MADRSLVPPLEDDEFRFGIWWKRTPDGGWRDARLSECATEIQALRRERDEAVRALDRWITADNDADDPEPTPEQLKNANNARLYAAQVRDRLMGEI